MEVDPVERHPVHFGLGRPQAFEQGKGAVAHCRGEVARLDQLADRSQVAAVAVVMVVVMIMGVRMTVLVGVMMMAMLVGVALLGVGALDRPAFQGDAKAGAHEAAAHRPPALHSHVREPQTGHGVLEHLDRHAEVEAGAQEHVPGNAARTIQMVAAGGRHGAG